MNWNNGKKILIFVIILFISISVYSYGKSASKSRHNIFYYYNSEYFVTNEVTSLESINEYLGEISEDILTSDKLPKGSKVFTSTINDNILIIELNSQYFVCRTSK